MCYIYTSTQHACITLVCKQYIILLNYYGRLESLKGLMNCWMSLKQGWFQHSTCFLLMFRHNLLIYNFVKYYVSAYIEWRVCFSVMQYMIVYCMYIYNIYIMIYVIIIIMIQSHCFTDHCRITALHVMCNFVLE